MGSDNGNGQEILVEKTMMAMQKQVTQEIWFICFALKSTLFSQEISRILLKLESETQECCNDPAGNSFVPTVHACIYNISKFLDRELGLCSM
jgi:hypothetical protein